MHTLCRANQCHSNAAAGPRGPAGGGGTLCDAPPLRPGRRSGGPGRRSCGPGRRSCGPGRRSPVAACACACFVLPGDAAAAAAPCLPGEGTAREGEAEAREDEVVARAGEAGGAASRDSAAASDGPRIRSNMSFPPDLLALRTPVAGCCLVTASSQSCSKSSMFSLCCRSEYDRKADAFQHRPYRGSV